METERITREDTDCENTVHFVRHTAYAGGFAIEVNGEHGSV